MSLPELNDIAGLTPDSRHVKPGWLFAALAGSRQDGSAFIADAVRNGASVVLVRRGTKLPPEAAGIRVIESDNPARDLSLLAAQFYKIQPGHIVAVTGTNGKTSTVHFTQQIWQKEKLKSVSLGTLGIRGSGIVRSGSMTTPDTVSLHAELADLASAGITHLAMEASSHGLKQHRLDGVRINAAGFTNLTRDHLDYHPDMEDYFAAKARLFMDILKPDGLAVINADVPEFDALADICRNRKISVQGYGAKGHDMRLLKRVPLPQGQEVHLDIFGKKHDLVLPMVGAFQVMNALCALGLSMSADPAKNTTDYLSTIQGAPGRLQLIPGHPKGAVYVDYAHTPDALDNILDALRPHTAGRLICLFGCGGDRDPGKRAMMGRIASEKSDHVIVTDDNPRSENPELIRDAIMSGTKLNAKNVGDRRKAIAGAIEDMKTGDVLVLAGKGHEQGQIFADHVEPFDDAAEAAKAIQSLKGVAA